MIINLAKRFCFRRDANEYSGVYMFKNHKSKDDNDVYLELKFSINEEEEKVYQVNKPTAALFQSNDVIEEMIADEVAAFCNSCKQQKM